MIFDRWVYMRTFVMDGNFSAQHMKMRIQDNDVPITNGTGFMAETSRYSKHLMVSRGNTEVKSVYAHMTAII